MNWQHEEDFPGWFWRVVRDVGPTQAVHEWVPRRRGQVGDVLRVTRLPYVVTTLVQQYAPVSAPDLGGLVAPWQELQALRDRLAAPQLPGEFDRLYDEHYTTYNEFVSLIWLYRYPPIPLGPPLEEVQRFVVTNGIVYPIWYSYPHRVYIRIKKNGRLSQASKRGIERDVDWVNLTGYWPCYFCACHNEPDCLVCDICNCSRYSRPHDAI